MSSLMRDALAILGLVLVCAGLAFIAWPAVLVFVGLVCMAVGVVPSTRKRKGP